MIESIMFYKPPKFVIWQFYNIFQYSNSKSKTMALLYIMLTAGQTTKTFDTVSRKNSSYSRSPLNS